MKSVLKEFRPALIFLAKFLTIYLVGNVVYGLYVESYHPNADPITRLVTVQTSGCLNKMGYRSEFANVEGMAKVSMLEAGEVVLYVYEGCNGLNVMIVLVAFLFAYGGNGKWLSAFIFLGMLLIHAFNLLRIGLLYHLALNNDTHFYYYHKYFFTASLYIIVFILWFIWVTRVNERPRNAAAK